MLLGTTGSSSCPFISAFLTACVFICSSELERLEWIFFFNFLLIPSLIKELIFHLTFCQCPPAKDHTHRNAPTVDKAGLLGWVVATQANTSHGVTQNVLESTNIGFESVLVVLGRMPRSGVWLWTGCCQEAGPSLNVCQVLLWWWTASISPDSITVAGGLWWGLCPTTVPGCALQSGAAFPFFKLEESHSLNYPLITRNCSDLLLPSVGRNVSTLVAYFCIDWILYNTQVPPFL